MKVVSVPFVTFQSLSKRCFLNVHNGLKSSFEERLLLGDQDKIIFCIYIYTYMYVFLSYEL